MGQGRAEVGQGRAGQVECERCRVGHVCLSYNE